MTPPIVDSSLVNLVPSGTAVPEGISEGTAVPYYFEVLQRIILINLRNEEVHVQALRLLLSSS